MLGAERRVFLFIYVRKSSRIYFSGGIIALFARVCGGEDDVDPAVRLCKPLIRYFKAVFAEIVAKNMRMGHRLENQVRPPRNVGFRNYILYHYPAHAGNYNV